MPPISGLFLLTVAVVPEILHRRERLIGRSAVQFLVGFREIRHNSVSPWQEVSEDVKEQQKSA
jgi:hypothetical protein